MTHSERVEAATRSLLERHPDLEDDLAELVAIDATTDTWSFADIPLDSGSFGELVSQGIADQADDGDYRLVDARAVADTLDADLPENVAASLNDGQAAADRYSDDATGQESDQSGGSAGILTGGRSTLDRVGEGRLGTAASTQLSRIDHTAAIALALVLTILATARSLFYPSVFRDGLVVSPANDPYFYRYWQRHFLEQSEAPTDLGMAATIGEETSVRPLTHASNWWLTSLVGGSGSADTLAAWLPVLLAVAGGLVLYLLAVRLTADRRIGLAAVLLLALTPHHAVYTSLGFLEHRPYQYFWLLVLAFCLVWFAVDSRRRLAIGQPGAVAHEHLRSPATWAIAAVLAIAVAASAHTWGGSPLTFMPVALYLALRVAMDVRHDVPPLPANAPAIAGIGAGGLLAWLAYSRLGWHESIAATAPLLVALGGIGVGALATLWHRTDWRPAWLVAGEVILAFVGVFLYRHLRPDEFSRLRNRADDLFGRDAAIEATSLFGSDFGVLMEPLAQLGIGFFLALAPLAIFSWYVTKAYAPGWLALVCFAWFYLVLAAIQSRFAAQLGLFLMVFGAVALVYVLAALELIRPVRILGTRQDDEEQGRPQSMPTHSAESDGGSRAKPRSFGLPRDYRTGGYLVAILAMALVLNLIFLPTLLGQIQYDDDEIEATMAIADHAATVEDHPQTYVLSTWGTNRMHNFFVSGEARSYRYAADTHPELLAAPDADAGYDRLGSHVGYVVVREGDAAGGAVHDQLVDGQGMEAASSGHYALLYSGEDIRAFAVVPGAELVVTSEAESVTARTTVSVGDTTFSYNRTGSVSGGEARLRVAHPGEYEVAGTTVGVAPGDVYRGQTVEVAGETE